MLIGIDASRATAAQRTGTETYSLHLIRELLAQGQTHRFRLYFNQAPSPGLFAPGAEQHVMPFPRMWTHLRLSWEMRSRPPEVLFVPSHVLPLVHPRRCVVTVHDLGYHYHPEAHTLSQNLYLRWSTRFNAHSATRVLADSQATRQDLIALYQVPAAKIQVVYPGRDETLAPVTDAARLAAVRGRYGVTERYLLYVGTLHPRKNLVRLIRSFARLLGSGVQLAGLDTLQLVLAGQKGWLYDEIVAEVRRLHLAERVVLTGFVPDSDLPALLSGAQAFLFPSLYEGFGFPVLEAMACGTPVVCSNRSSLPEVAGEAALQVDPLDTEALAAAIERLLVDEGLRQELARRGLAQIERFSWRRCAAEVLEVLEAAGHGSD